MIIKKFWKPVCWAIIIGVLSFMPTDDLDTRKWFEFEHQDKLLHLFFYGVFSFLVFRSFTSYFNTSKPSWLIYLLTFLVIFLYGLVIEIIQGRFTASRQGDIADLIFNLTGYMIAMLFLLLIPFLRISQGIK
jgi:glycopeptide antibiotics resistance protein